MATPMDPSSDLLSASRIASAMQRARSTQREIWISDDVGIRGVGRLALRITPRGIARFYMRQSRQGKRKLTPVGPYSHKRCEGYLTISEARAAARQSASGAPSSLSRPAGPQDTPRSATPPLALQLQNSVQHTFLTLEELCNAYVESLRAEGKAHSAREAAGHFRRHINGTELGRTPASQVQPRQLTNLLRTLVECGRGKPASKLRSVLHTAYARAIKAATNPRAPMILAQSNIDSNPVANIDAMPEFKVARKRALRKSELAAVWVRLVNAKGHLPLVLRLVRLSILLGGQRARQLLRVTIDQVDLEAGTIPLFDGKGRRPERVRTYCRWCRLPKLKSNGCCATLATSARRSSSRAVSTARRSTPLRFRTGFMTSVARC